MAAGGSFIAQSFSSDAKRHTEIVQEAIGTTASAW